MSLEFFNFPSKIGNISEQCSCISPLVTTITRWQALDIGIMMGCLTSPLLFIISMELIIQGAADTAKGVFMDDIMT